MSIIILVFYTQNKIIIKKKKKLTLPMSYVEKVGFFSKSLELLPVTDDLEIMVVSEESCFGMLLNSLFVHCVIK